MVVVSLTEDPGPDANHRGAFFYCHLVVPGHPHAEITHIHIINVFCFYVNR